MNMSMIRAWFLGFGVLLIGHVAWYFVLKTGNLSSLLTFFWWGSTAIAGFVSAYFSPKKKIYLGLSLAIPAALMAGALNFIYEMLGHAVDFPGFHATLILVGLTLPWDLILCTLGSGVGYFVTRKS